MYGELLQQISFPPAAEVSNPTYTLAVDGTVGFVDDPVHGMAPHVILLVVRIKLFNVRDPEAFPFTYILKTFLVTGPTPIITIISQTITEQGPWWWSSGQHARLLL